LQGKRVMSLDMGLLLAGAKERGELESRVTNLIEETRSAGWCLPSMSKYQT
jgi:ATP-dependent Clp protease ATP-binding subunit ClpC